MCPLSHISSPVHPTLPMYPFLLLHLGDVWFNVISPFSPPCPPGGIQGVSTHWPSLEHTWPSRQSSSELTHPKSFWISMENPYYFLGISIDYTWFTSVLCDFFIWSWEHVDCSALCFSAMNCQLPNWHLIVFAYKSIAASTYTASSARRDSALS